MLINYEFDISQDLLRRCNPGILRIEDYALVDVIGGTIATNQQAAYSLVKTIEQADSDFQALYTTVPSVVALLQTPAEIFQVPPGIPYQYPTVLKQDPLTLYRQCRNINPQVVQDVYFSDITFYFVMVDPLDSNKGTVLPGSTTQYVVFHKIV